MEFQYSYGDKIYSIRLNPQPDGTYTAVIDDREYIVVVHRQQEGALTLLIDGKPARAHVAAHKNQRFVGLSDGVTYELETADRAISRRKSAAGAAGSLTAQMPGQVTHVMVHEGETVELGQTLIVMEAMKMEIRITAPVGGNITKLHVQQGDTVDRGQRLVEVGVS
ncbi:MAG: biotin/lipoyl-binding protein [Chloroflexi bacterium]|nr:biotin/lipoyl-binding protein [Chloroflexota bacterium]